MSTYETTAGLGDERVRILPRRGLVKNHYYTRATHGIVEVMWSNRGAFVERDFAIVVLKCRMRVPRSPKEQIVRNEVQERKPLTIGY